MHVLNEGNMTYFHYAYCSFFPKLLMFKVKYGHVGTLQVDPKKELIARVSTCNNALDDTWRMNGKS